MKMTTDASDRAADLLAKRLYEAGCRYAFGMPGGEVLTIVDALEKAGIQFILCKHENNAGFMAEGMHHRTGAPAVLVATVGPGAMNCINVVANAFQDRVPLVVITGCVDADEALTYTHQVMDHAAVFAPVTKATFRLTSKGADIISDKALAIACEGRCGPVHIDVPIGAADERPGSLPIRRRGPCSLAQPAAGADVDQAREWLAHSHRPAMIIGLDALHDQSGAQIRQFAEKYAIPFITTYKAKGIIREDHPLCLGGAGLSPLSDKTLIPFVQSADLILCVGYDPIEMRPGWREAWNSDEVPVIDISAEANTHYMHQARLNFVAHTGAALSALQDGVVPRQTWAEGQIKAAQEKLAVDFPCDEIWGPGAVIDECRRNLPEGTIATADSGAHRILLSQMWRSFEPRTFLQSSAFCTMGCAVPLAMGAKLAEPDRQVISFSGDAGLLMVAGELSTAAELRANTIFVVFVDASLSLIELKQRQRQLENNGVDFAPHDFAEIGKAFGGNGVTVTDRQALSAALEQAKTADTFTVIAAMIDKHAYDGRI